MTTAAAIELLEKVRDGKVSLPEALNAFQAPPTVDLGFANIDVHRSLRKGFAEVVYCGGKTASQIVRISERILENDERLLLTRLSPDQAAAVKKKFKRARYHEAARCITIETRPQPKRPGTIAIVCAGTSDLPVAEEACVTADIMGNTVERVYDVGVAGLHRLLNKLPLVQKANVVVVVAGMEGALPSVVAGLVSRPVIAVPTSVGYGANFAGLTPLLSMLNSCSSGVTVVNIDNGFGAGYAASQINALSRNDVKTLYLDIFSGISGDMFMGAMLDLGIAMEDLERELGKLRVEGYHLHGSREKRFQIEGARFEVHVGHHQHDEPDHGHEHDHPHAHEHEHHHEHQHGNENEHEHPHSHEHGRTYADIKKLIEESPLSKWVKAKSIAVFERIAAAEGKIHGLPAAEVHFHEVGALDSIVDIIGACVALELLGKPRVLSSKVVDGHGWVDCAHGRFPVPAPATMEILAARGVPITQCDEPAELVTPTGAALLAEFAEHFGPMENFVPQRVGFGIGKRHNKTRPNVLRAVLGETASAAAHDWETDTIAVLETNLDDVNPELLGHFVDLAMAAGALDVSHAPVQMKKNRPGVLLSVLCAPEQADKFSELILRQTSAFGVRRSLAERRKLRRRFITVRTQFGDATVKIGSLDGEIVQIAPEFESCKKLAAEKNVPLKTVYDAARKAAE